MPEPDAERPGIEVEIPGREVLRLESVVFDFNGTLATAGRLTRGVRPRLRRLARGLRLIVMTADTFGTAARALHSLPVEIQTVRTGAEKAQFIKAEGPGVAVVGNGRNDLPMFRAARFGIAVVGREGAAPELLSRASVVVTDIRDALDLLLDPRRLVATLRE